MASRCRFCKRLESACASCRERGAHQMMMSRIRRGLVPLVKCFRCLGKHPKGERYCKLAAEFCGYPWKDEAEC